MAVQEGQQESAATNGSLVAEVAKITEGRVVETVSSRIHFNLISCVPKRPVSRLEYIPPYITTLFQLPITLKSQFKSLHRP